MAQPEWCSSCPPHLGIWLNITHLPTRISNFECQTSQKQTANRSDTRQLHNFHKETKPHRLKTGLCNRCLWVVKTRCYSGPPALGWPPQTAWPWDLPCPDIHQDSVGGIFFPTAATGRCDIFSSTATKEPRVTPKYCSILIATGTCLWIKKRRYFPLPQSNYLLRYALVQSFQDLN